MTNRIAWRSAAVLLALALLPRCACDTVPSDAVQKCSTAQVFAGHVKTDILFVIDDSGSMSQEQANLSANLGAFIDRLATLPIQDDYQIGVTTTDVDDFGGGTNFTTGPEVGNPYPRGAIVAITQNGSGIGQAGDLVYNPASFPSTNGWGGNRILPKGSPTLIQDFKANVLVGIAGSGKEQPFRAVKMALTDRILDGTNAGFLRPGAALAIIFASDEDDCSDSAVPPKVTSNTACHDLTNKQTLLDSVGDFAAFLQGPIQGEVRDTVVASIVGVGEGTLDLACVPTTCCTTAFDRGDRHVALLQAMGPRSRLASICDTDFSATLADFANAIMSDTLPLEGTPADWHMLVASVTKAGGTKVACKIASATDSTPAERAAADAIYSAPQAGLPASLTFQGNCSLSPGDLIDVGVVCAG
ncbi:MAG TPA: hypothetical protein VIV57_20770 [Anaeromyxobacter sp.]